jgi:glucosamine--fructose-6-phosphate aminotransferase (isomerizing)
VLALEADVSLHIGSLSDQMVAIQTYTGTLLTTYLVGRAVQDSLEDVAAGVDALLPAFSQLVAQNMEAIQDWDSFLDNGSPVHLLARGPSYSSALEGALLFNEIAKAPAVSMPVGSFRHGPVELVDRDFRGIIFAQHGRTQELNLSLAGDLVRFGGRVRVIGPYQPSSPTVEWCSIPAVPEMLSPIFDIVPVQVAALRMAELKGIAPGTFRYTPQVATNETTFATPDANAVQHNTVSRRS